MKKLPTGVPGFDRVLDGGFTPGSTVLLSGEPGAGKTTLALQIANSFAKTQEIVLYVSGEQHHHALIALAKRIGCTQSNLLYLTGDNDAVQIEYVLEQAAEIKPPLLVIDSISSIEAKGSRYKKRSSSVQTTKQVIAYVHKTKTCALVISHKLDVDVVKFMCATTLLLDHQQDTDKETPEGEHIRVLTCEKNRNGGDRNKSYWSLTAKGMISIKAKAKK